MKVKVIENLGDRPWRENDLYQGKKVKQVRYLGQVWGNPHYPNGGEEYELEI